MSLVHRTLRRTSITVVALLVPILLAVWGGLLISLDGGSADTQKNRSKEKPSLPLPLFHRRCPDTEGRLTRPYSPPALVPGKKLVNGSPCS